MAKIRNPIRFSEYFHVDANHLSASGVLDPTLNVDTRLFIDPLLLPSSRHPEISQRASATYNRYFEHTIILLGAIQSEGDAYWRHARRRLSFPEINGTCLGYGAGSIAGSGSGRDTTDHVFKTAREIVALGIRDPDLFVAMALLEDNFGPDRISDMTTNIILGELLALNYRILSDLNVPLEDFKFRLKNESTFRASLPRNPCSNGRVPIILVPTDLLRDLPVASDWEDVAVASSESAEIRSRVNEQIAQLWRRKTLEDKEKMRNWALSDKGAFETLLKMIHSADRAPYDIESDPQGELFWRQLVVEIAQSYSFTIKRPQKSDLDGVNSVVEQVIGQFKFLVEERRL